MCEVKRMNIEKETNKLFRNAIFNTIYKMMNVFFPLIISIYASHILKASGIGRVASAQNIVQYFVLIASLGIPNYGVREIAKRRNCNKQRNIVFSELFILNFISSIVSFLIYSIMVAFFMDNTLLNKIFGSVIILNIINVDWIYQGEEEYKYIAARSFIVKVFSILLLVLLVKSENDYIQYALVTIMAITGNNLYNIFHLRKLDISLIYKELNFSRHFKPIFILLGTTISIELYTLLDTTMLTILCTEEQVGYYTVAMKIPKMIIVAVTGVSGVLLPTLSRFYMEGNIYDCNLVIRKIVEVLFVFFIPAGIGIIILAPQIIEVLFGSSFRAAVITLQISALLIYTLGFSNLFGTQVLMTVGYEKGLLFSTIIGASVNVLLNILLIPLYAQNGAAFASVLSEGVVTAITYTQCKRFFQVNISSKIVSATLFSGGMMSIFCVFCSNYIHNTIIALFVGVGGGIIVYILFNLLTKNPLILGLRYFKR